MSQVKRSIKDLVNLNNERVYVYLANNDIGNRFMQQAEDEGFTFNGGVKPTDRCYAEIMAVNDDCTINFVGSVGRMAFGSGAETVGNRKLLRVDFEKYTNGNDDYRYG